MRLTPYSPLLLACALCMAHWACPHPAAAQLVQPVISEYKSNASGKLLITNNTAEPLVAVLDPRSFSISPEGHGTFRALDPGIEVQLSATSVKLQPQQSYYIFYKASAKQFPAWFTIYTTFSQVKHGKELDVRIQLPHTVYLYQKKPLDKSEIQVTRTIYATGQHQLLCELKNTGTSLGRARQVKASGPHGGSATTGGFPLLPGMTRLVTIDWKEHDPPSALVLDFDHFSLKPPITIEASLAAEGVSSAPSPVSGARPTVPTPANPMAKVLVPPGR